MFLRRGESVGRKKLHSNGKNTVKRLRDEPPTGWREREGGGRKATGFAGFIRGLHYTLSPLTAGRPTDCDWRARRPFSSLGGLSRAVWYLGAGRRKEGRKKERKPDFTRRERERD